MVQYRPHTARAGRFSQRAQWGLHLGLAKHYEAWRIFDFHTKETVAARDVIFYERLTLALYLDNIARHVEPTGGFSGSRAFASPSDAADWEEENIDGASEAAGPLPYCSVPIPMDDENPRDSVNANAYYHFADTGYVTPQPVNTNISERYGPGFTPDPDTGDEAVYPEDPLLNRHAPSGLQVLGLVTAVHGTSTPLQEPRSVKQALGGNTKKNGAKPWKRIDVNIFVEQPHGFVDDPSLICKLLKSLYGIKQAPRLWQQYLHARLKHIGFDQLPHDQGMYRLTRDNDYVLLIVYVDDLLYIGSTTAIVTWFEKELQTDLSLTVSPDVTQYLGLNILDEDNAIHLSTSKYANVKDTPSNGTGGQDASPAVARESNGQKAGLAKAGMAKGQRKPPHRRERYFGDGSKATEAKKEMKGKAGIAAQGSGLKAAGGLGDAAQGLGLAGREAGGGEAETDWSAWGRSSADDEGKGKGEERREAGMVEEGEVEEDDDEGEDGVDAETRGRMGKYSRGKALKTEVGQNRGAA
ncbi:unnamed protein product, partial [Closterium sp. NIES-53]